MKKMNKWLQRCKAAGKTFLAAFAVFLLNTQTAYASGISESKLAKGTEKLIGDATTWLMVLAPVVAGLLIIYFCIRRSAADEMDQKKWNNRIVVAIVSCIGAVIGSATLVCLSFSVRLAQYEELILIPFWITAVILGWHIIKMAPIEHKNRILIEDERRIFRRRSIQIYIFWLVVGIILWMVRLVQMETSLISAFIAITILMRIGGISNYEKRSASGVSKSGE